MKYFVAATVVLCMAGVVCLLTSNYFGGLIAFMGALGWGLLADLEKGLQSESEVNNG